MTQKISATWHKALFIHVKLNFAAKRDILLFYKLLGNQCTQTRQIRNIDK